MRRIFSMSLMGHIPWGSYVGVCSNYEIPSISLPEFSRVSQSFADTCCLHTPTRFPSTYDFNAFLNRF